MRSPQLLRARLRSSSMVLLAAAAVLLFGVPLAVAVQRIVAGEALSALQRDATRAVAAVPDNTLEAGSGLVVPRTAGETRVGLYNPAGRRLAGHGPAFSRLAASVADGRERDGHENGELVVASPVLSDTTVAGSVRAAVAVSSLRSREWRDWAGLAGLAVLVLALTALLARRSARRLAEPFEQLTAAAQTLGAGSFDLALPRWGITEADAAGAALQRSAGQVGELVWHERAFVRHVSHQLRTPLAGLVVQLERMQATGDEGAAAALERAHHLERTIADLLAVRVAADQQTCQPNSLAEDAVARWRTTTDRAVTLRSDQVGAAGLPAAALRQALDVLMDNAFRHGAGRVTVTVEPLGERIVVEVADQGAGFGDAAAEGVGLRLAAGLVEQFGGDLLIRRRAPHPRVGLLLPAVFVAGEPAADDQSTSNR